MTIAGAVLLAAIAGALHWKHRVPRVVAWLLLFAGIGLAGTVVQYLGGVKQVSLLGVGVMAIIAIVTAIFFWEEAVRRNGIHRVRTPIIAAVFGVALMSAGGSVFQAIQNTANAGGKNLDKVVTNSLNGK